MRRLQQREQSSASAAAISFAYEAQTKSLCSRSEVDRLSSPRENVDVVIVTYESRDFLERCLEAWSAAGIVPVVVDNASSDGSADVSVALGAEVIALDENLGYGGAANRGIAEGRRPLVLVANADAWPREAADVDRLVEHVFADDGIGAAGPAFADLDGRPQATLRPAASRWWLGRAAVTSFPDGGPAATHSLIGDRPSYLVGATTLFRRAALDQVGGFDPAFFLFNEEVDLCLRLAAAGWRLAVAGESRFVHVGGVSTRPRWRLAYREQLRSHLRLLDKHEGRDAAEHARRWLAFALVARSVASSTTERRFLGETARWLRRSTVAELLDGSGPRKESAARPV